MYRSAPAMPAWSATLDTVSGLSPEMTFTVTPCLAKYSKVSLASGRMGLHSTARATGSTAPPRPAWVGVPEQRPSSSTRLPAA